MNPKILAAALLTTALVFSACDKQKSCRCSVAGSPQVRIVKIDKGECDQIKSYQYHDVVDTLNVDTLLCTGYEFAIDSIFKE